FSIAKAIVYGRTNYECKFELPAYIIHHKKFVKFSIWKIGYFKLIVANGEYSALNTKMPLPEGRGKFLFFFYRKGWSWSECQSLLMHFCQLGCLLCIFYREQSE